ncbi:MAG TPA: sigma-54 dependent transcriptional regulator [Blastocatellia bacterium]|nr:sigma-54 dependent transcriptional regulator [Blastocatellia bacterium]
MTGKILPKILVADDDRLIRMTLETGLTLNGFQVSLARSGRETIAAAREQNFDAVISDIYMPDGNGLEVVRELRATQPLLPVILMTAQGELDVTVQALAEGANDIIAKPFEIAMLVSVLQKHLGANREKTAAQDSQPEADFSRSGLVGRSAAMIDVYKLIAYAARTDVTVMITGESGTGKELAARAIHEFSARKTQPFIAVNCSGLTDTLLEAELFGHTKGSFTGANTDRTGFFEAADGGTLFLDELASTSQAFQASLLRVLQSGEVRRVGATATRRVNVRVIGASNSPLRELAERGGFRPDLYYRLSVLTIDLPPLRERAGDIELLAQHLLRRNSAGNPAPILSQEVVEALLGYRFPGNVRELENALKRASALSTNGVVTLDCLPPYIVAEGGNASTDSTPGESLQNLATDWPTLEELERRYLQLVLEKVHGNRQHASDLLGTARRTVQRLIARYGLGTSEESAIEFIEESTESPESPLQEESSWK